MEPTLELIDEMKKSRRPIRVRQTATASMPDSPLVTTVTCLTEIVAKPEGWLWGDMIPLGKVTALVGASGVGKSFVVLDMVAAVTCGAPGASKEPRGEPGNVMLVSPEYELAGFVKPRLEAMGAAMQRIHAVRGIHLQAGGSSDLPCWLFQLNQDLQLLEQEIAQRKATGSPIRLIVIDPFPTELFERAHGTAELIQTMNHLAEVAAWSEAAIIVVAQTQTSPRRTLTNLINVLETTAQSAWTLVCDPDYPQRRLLLPIKANLKEESPGMSLMICDGVVHWQPDPVKMTAEQFRAEARVRSRTPLFEQEWSEVARATAWLRRRLKNGVVPLRIVKLESAANDISFTTLRRAFCGIRGISRRTEGTRMWEWALPNTDTPQAPVPPWWDSFETDGAQPAPAEVIEQNPGAQLVGKLPSE